MAEAKFGVKEVMNVTFYDLTSYKPVLYVDTLKMSNLENTAEESLARGGWGNPILLTWDYNREANFAVQDALISFDGLSLMTGKPVTATSEIIFKREFFSGAEIAADPAGSVTLSQTPVDPATGLASDDRVFVYDASGGIGGTPVGTVSGTTVSDLGDYTDGVVAYYPYQNESTDLQVVSIDSDSFPGFYKIVGDTLIRNSVTGVDEPFQIIVEKVKVQPGFTLTMQAEGDPSVFDMNLKVLRPDDGTTMIKMIKYTEGS